MSGELGWAVLSVVAVLSSIAAGMGLPGATFAAAPDGTTFKPAGALLGGACGNVPADAARIASASLITDEILIEILPEERLEAVSYVVDWPRSTAAYGRFSPALKRTWGHAEQLLRLDADRILVSEYNGSLPAAHLASAGRCVAQLSAPHSIDEVLQSISWVGRVAGAQAEAGVLLSRLRARLSALPTPSKGERPRAMVLQGLMVYGGRTVQGDCLSRAGFANVATELGIDKAPTLSAEVLLRLDLDVLFIAADVSEPEEARPADLPAGVLWQQTPVMKRGRIIVVPETWVGSLSQHAIRACEAYARFARAVAPIRVVAPPSPSGAAAPVRIAQPSKGESSTADRIAKGGPR